MAFIKRSVSFCVALFITFALGIRASADYKFNMSYIYFGTSSGYTTLVDATQNSLNEVAPNYFNLDANGNLVITNAVNQGFVDDMHARGIRVAPYLTNDWDREIGINALSDIQTLATDLKTAIETYNLDGVNVDLENLTEYQRAGYVDFVRLLRESLPAEKTIAVAVAANPHGYNTGWQGSYDYTGLAAYCDYLMIMAYDESYYGSKPGPVASYTFIENSIKYALGHIAPDKIVLGLPFYGRIWADSGAYPKGFGVSNTRVDQYVAKYSGSVTYDSASRSARANITVKPSDVKPVVGGKVLASGTYTIWYENEQSLKSKLTLVEKYNLKGAGSWSLGQEPVNTWDYYKLWLNGCTFDDVQESWAKDYILSAYKNEWVNGVSDDNFLPEANLSRAQAAAMLVRRLGLSVEANAEYCFNDTAGSWAEGYINTARKHQIISGVGNNQFEPDKPVTREEIAVMLNNILGYECQEVSGIFHDISNAFNPWSYEAIHALSKNAVITGYSDGSYRPQSNVTRAEMTTLMYRIENV